MKPPQFTLRALLVAVTIAAIGLCVWRVNYSPRPITEIDAKVIEVGNSKWQVRYLLGPPHYTGEYSWGYDLQNTFEYLNVEFENERVVTIERCSWLPSLNDYHNYRDNP